MKYKITRTAILGCLLLSITSFVSAQRADIPFHMEQIAIDLGVHNGNEVLIQKPDDTKALKWDDADYKVVSKVINPSTRAPWIQLQFSNVNLGEDSYMTITSSYDGDQQRHTSETLKAWEGWSAFFKGESVEVALYIAPNEKEISATVEQLLVGEFAGGKPINLRSQCGPDDDRATSGIPMRDGRLMPLGCTGWTTAAGYYLTAGHCLNVSSSALVIMEFDVPSSLADGTTQPAAVTNQYPVIYSSRDFQDAGIGDDWGIYDVGANSNTGFTPNEARRSYYHLSKANPTADIQIRGFGTDNVPTGSTGGRNSDNQTLQWHAGPNLGETITSVNEVYWEYQADTEGGNSGSSVRATSNPNLHHAIGIHTHAGCGTTTGNHGTSFEANDTETAMNTYWQTEVEYVDVDHHLTSSIGSSVLPHESLQNALDQANAGHGPAESALELILIAGSNVLSDGAPGSGGIYAETISYSGAINGVILRATVGAVKIGPNASSLVDPNSSRVQQSNETAENGISLNADIKDLNENE